MKLVSSSSDESRSDASSGPRRQLIALHKRLYRRQRRRIEATLGSETPEFRRYRLQYERAVRRFDEVVDYDEVIAAGLASSLILVGDYHTLRQAQRSTVKLAVQLLARGAPLLLGLEFVQGRYQAAVDGYLAGVLDDEAFLRAIHYRQLQPFDLWSNFKPLFDLAREAKLPVVAIDSPAGGPASLRARDRYAGQALAAAMRSHVDRLPVVLMGQLHLAPGHLPAALPPWVSDRSLRSSRSPRGARPPLTVYQNCEEIYFELERRGHEQTVEAVRLDSRTYCLINSSPLVCQQSYLDWVEATALGERVEEITPEAHFREAGNLFAEFIEIVPPRPLEEVEIASPGNLALFRRLERDNPREFRLLSPRILSGESFCLPGHRAVYLAESSLNRAAEVAARYLWHLCADEDGEPRGLVDAFYAAALEQALGFFGSKVVNPRRKAQHRPQLLARLQQPVVSRMSREVAQAVLAHQRFEAGERAPEVQRLYTLRDPERFHAVTRALGQVLGDKLYYGLLKGRIGKAEIRSLFFDPFEDEGAALHTYLYLIGKVGRTRIPVRRG